MKLTLTVGTKNWSSWSLRGWLALKASGLPFEERYVRLRHDGLEAELEKVSPSRLIPVLAVEDGASRYQVWDSLAIGEFVAELAPEAGLFPSDRQARAEARSVIAEMHSGFQDLRKQLSMEFARHLPGEVFTEGTQKAIRRIKTIWSEALERSGGPYLFGPTFGLADIAYAPVVSRFRTYDVPLEGALKDYAERVWQHPFMQAWLKDAADEVAAGKV